MREHFPRQGKLCWCWYISLSPNHEVPTSRNFNFTLPRVIEENLSAWEFLQTRQERERGVHCVLAQGELHTSAVCTVPGGAEISVSPKGRQGDTCADVYLVFHSLHLQGMIFALGWKSLLLLWRSPGTVLAKTHKSPELRSPLFCLCLWTQGVSSPLCSSAFQAVGEVPAPQGQWLIWKCAESHHCLETYGYYSLIKGNSNFPGDKSCRMQLYYYEQVRI